MMPTQSATTLTPPLPEYLPPNTDAPPITAGPVLPLPGGPFPPPGGPFPPPGGPFPLPGIPFPFPPPQLPSVRCGCWLLGYRPKGAPLVAYDGTLRVECHSAGRTASGDLYQRPVKFFPPPISGPLLLSGPNPVKGIPILPRGQYRYYVRVTSLPETTYIGLSFKLGFELWRFTAPNSWALESTLTAKMVRMAAPAGYPSSSDYAEGDVANASGTVVGRLTMGWLSTYFRKCTVEIDTVNGSEQPINSGVGHTWKTVMDAVGWDVNLQLSDTNVTEPSGNSWSDAEMHAAMLARRAATNLDAEWRYHVLAVKNIDSTPRGIMYDAGGTDSNNVPREGIGIASHWTIDPTWGTVGGQRFGTAAAPYFRTAIHEVGHAMGLFHNFADHGFMCTSDVIAAAGTPGTPFPSNIQWSYNADNLKQLRHYPDPFVRPGSVAFGGASATTPLITPTDLEIDMEGLALEVTPLLNEVPLGAPVRVGISLSNQSDRPIRVPADLSLKGEFVSGSVTDPTGIARTFRTVIRCIEDHPFAILEPGETIDDSMTLMRGAEGALFGIAGVHEVQVKVHWEIDEMTAHVAGSATVMVTGVTDAGHAAAAHKVLATPDAHLVLAIGGDHLTDGIEAIQSALDSPVLRPHFAAVEAKRLGRHFGKRKSNLKAAAALVDETTVMSGTEVGRLAKLVTDEGGGTVAAKEMTKTLKSKAKTVSLTDAAQKAVDEL